MIITIGLFVLIVFFVFAAALAFFTLCMTESIKAGLVRSNHPHRENAQEQLESDGGTKKARWLIRIAIVIFLAAALFFAYNLFHRLLM